MTVRLIAFSTQGMALAQRLADSLGGSARRCGRPPFLQQWTADGFASADALVFVGAAGIAVRAIAPHVKSKTTDPAVVVLDDCGRFAVPILSGHLGGANDLARKIAALCGAVPVITTATDVNGRFAVDAWARCQGCRVEHTHLIKEVSGRILAGQSVGLYSAWPVRGNVPEGVTLTEQQDCAVQLALTPAPAGVLGIVPRIAVVGVGCRKNTPQAAVEAAFDALLRRTGISPLAVRRVCSIDLKKDEPGLCAFCADRGFEFITYPADALRAVEGCFSASAFVQSVTGVDNVCERSAVKGSGGALVEKKFAVEGVTMALALAPFAPDWSWNNE